MSLKLIKPTWEQVASGMKISREGTVLLEFANALAAQQYNWTQKEVRHCLGADAGACLALHAFLWQASHTSTDFVQAAAGLAPTFKPPITCPPQLAPSPLGRPLG